MTDTTNPKDLLGAKKIDLSLFPDVAVMIGAMAMHDGARKYGVMNWRAKHVRATVYISAARRHLLAWASGEEYAEDSGVHHLGHVLGCIAILLDAQVNGALVDDRYTSAHVVKLMADLNLAIAAKAPTPAAVSGIIELATEGSEAIEDVETLVGTMSPVKHEVEADSLVDLIMNRPVEWDFQGNPTDPHTDTEATEWVEWAGYPKNPYVNRRRKPTEANGLREGDVCYDRISQRQCRVDEFLEDGTAHVTYRMRDGSCFYGVTKWDSLDLVCTMEVSTAGEDRQQESSK